MQIEEFWRKINSLNSYRTEKEKNRLKEFNRNHSNRQKNNKQELKFIKKFKKWRRKK